MLLKGPRYLLWNPFHSVNDLFQPRTQHARRGLFFPGRKVEAETSDDGLLSPCLITQPAHYQRTDITAC